MQARASAGCRRCGRCCREAIIDTLTDADLRREPRLRTVVRRMKGGTQYLLPTPCPFLTENNECSIYETRPHVCREYVAEAGFFA